MNLGSQPTRVAYHKLERQVLRTSDLTDEQSYHLEMRRRHNLALHTWGIATGLGLKVDGNSVIVEAGLAIDGYGRELVLATPMRIPEVDPRLDPGPYDVVLNYGLSPDGCRLIEKPTITTGLTATRKLLPPAFQAYRPPPDGVAAAWPVLLGQIEWRASDAAPGGEQSWQIDQTVRRYAGLVAEQIVSRGAPLGSDGKHIHTVIQNGKAPNRGPYSFAVYPNQEGDGTQAANGDPPALALDDEKNLVLTGKRVTLGGDLVLLEGAALDLRPNRILSEEKEAQHQQGFPWRMYHFYAPSSVVNPSAANTPAVESVDELRICMAGTPPGSNQVSIGHWTDKGKFKAVLTIRDNGEVTVNGDLFVTGSVDDKEGRLFGRRVQASGEQRGSASPDGSRNPREQLEQLIRDNGVDVVIAGLMTADRQDEVVNKLLTPGSSFLNAVNGGSSDQKSAFVAAATATNPAEVLNGLLAAGTIDKFATAFSQNATPDNGVTFPDNSPVAKFVKYLKDHPDNQEFKQMRLALMHWLTPGAQPAPATSAPPGATGS